MYQVRFCFKIHGKSPFLRNIFSALEHVESKREWEENWESVVAHVSYFGSKLCVYETEKSWACSELNGNVIKMLNFFSILQN